MVPAEVPHLSYDSIISASDTWEINGKRVSARKAKQLGRSMQSRDAELFETPWAGSAAWGFCGTPMETPTVRIALDETKDWDVERCYHLAHCSYCCHWRFRASESTNKCMDASTAVIAESVARKFDEVIPDACSEELAQYLRRSDSAWHLPEPRRTERLIADFVRANYHNAEVVHVGKPGDLGVDVYFVDTQKDDWLIQVKRRASPNAVEGCETLQRLLGTLVLEGKWRGIIATTANRFSRQLLKQSRRAERQGYTSELLDRGKPNRMPSPLLPHRPWLELMKSSIFWALDEHVRTHFIEHTTHPSECLF